MYASFNYFEINLPKSVVMSVPMSGAADYAIAEARKKHSIKKELNKIDPEKLKKELREYGAWDESQLSNHEDNLNRILWLAVGNIQEEMH